MQRSEGYSAVRAVSCCSVALVIGLAASALLIGRPGSGIQRPGCRRAFGSARLCLLCKLRKELKGHLIDYSLRYIHLSYRLATMPAPYSSHTTHTGKFAPISKSKLATSSSNSPLVQFLFSTTRFPLFCKPIASSVPALLIANCRGKAP